MQYIVLERKVYERYSVVDADDPEEAEEILRERIREGKEDGPEQCSDSWCDVTEL